MKSTWFRGLTESSKEEMRAHFVGSHAIRKRLIEIAMSKIKTSNDLTRSKDSYSIANWAYLQADAIGYERALFEIISLCSEENVE